MTLSEWLLPLLSSLSLSLSLFLADTFLPSRILSRFHLFYIYTHHLLFLACPLRTLLCYLDSIFRPRWRPDAEAGPKDRQQLCAVLSDNSFLSNSKAGSHCVPHRKDNPRMHCGESWITLHSGVNDHISDGHWWGNSGLEVGRVSVSESWLMENCWNQSNYYSIIYMLYTIY